MSNITRFGRRVPFVPISYIGMKVRTFLDVMSQFGYIPMPRTAREILDFFSLLFGSDAYMTVKRGTHGWWMDQHMISQRLAEWTIKTVDR
jgi:hypothetical protein